MTAKIFRAFGFLRLSNNLLECAFWAADSLDDRGPALTSTIMEVQEKLEDAVALLERRGGRRQA